jgi:hypothetical protein
MHSISLGFRAVARHAECSPRISAARTPVFRTARNTLTCDPDHRRPTALAAESSSSIRRPPFALCSLSLCPLLQEVFQPSGRFAHWLRNLLHRPAERPCGTVLYTIAMLLDMAEEYTLCDAMIRRAYDFAFLLPAPIL